MKTLITLAARSLYIMMLLVCASFVVNLIYCIAIGEYAQATVIAIVGTLFSMLTYTMRTELWIA